MAYKYLNDDGLKAYTKKVKGALKDLHTPIAISTLNTTDSKAQNVRNIADFVAKAKAAGIADVNGMAVTCLIDGGYSGVGYLLMDGNNFLSISGAKSIDDVNELDIFLIDSEGNYDENYVLNSRSAKAVNSNMLDTGARKPIILTPETTEVDEETYQKLFPNGITTNDVDIMFRIGEYDYGLFLPLESSSIQDGEGYNELSFTGLSGGRNLQSIYIWWYRVRINTETPHQCTVTKLQDKTLNDILSEATNVVTSSMLTKGARKPIILTPSTTEVDEETYQKLLIDDVDVVFKADAGEYCALTYKEDAVSYKRFYFTCLSTEGGNTMGDTYIYAYEFNIAITSPHTCTITTLHDATTLDELIETEFIHKSILTSVPLTATTSTNKTQLDLFLSKVPNAQVMYVTYKDVYAGTLHKIGTDWFGLLVKNTNNYEDALQVKLQADGTLIEGTTSLAQVNAKLANIIG